MTVDRKAIDEMANIMRILSAQSEAAEASHDAVPASLPVDGGYPLAESYEGGYPMAEGYPMADGYPAPGNYPMAPEPVAARVAISTPETDAMKTILEAFHAAQRETPVEAAPAAPVRRPVDPEVAEALRTERTHRGARIGSWEIVVHEGKKGRTYDVVSEGGHTTIAKDLYVYDAAYGIAKRLNEGVAFNDPSVLKLLGLEEDFAKNRDDASGYRQRAKKLREKGEDLRAAVAEDRHDEAARQAIKAHEDILRLAGIRR